MGKQSLKLEKKKKSFIINSEEIPFEVIEEAPTTDNCKDASFDERKKCLSDFISKFVIERFNMKKAKNTGLKGRQRIMVNFKIDTNGFVKDVRARAAHPDFELEARRIVNLLPKFRELHTFLH